MKLTIQDDVSFSRFFFPRQTGPDCAADQQCRNPHRSQGMDIHPVLNDNFNACESQNPGQAVVQVTQLGQG